MKVKATTNFAGEICMAVGEVRDVPESVAAPLLDCGYLEPAEPEPEQNPQPESEKTPEKGKRGRAKTED